MYRRGLDGEIVGRTNQSQVTDGLPINKKIPQRLERQGISHFSKASDIDRVPTGELVFCTYPIQFP